MAMEAFVQDIKTYCALRGMALTTFGKYAADDGKLLSRLESGGEILPRTERRIRDYMAANPPQQKDVASQ